MLVHIMWFKLLLLLFVTMTTVTASIWLSMKSDHHPGRALVGHVFKTLPLFIADCLEVCRETMLCFSINVYKDKQGGDMCELNQLNKKQSPESFVHKEGYIYAEPKEDKNCVKDKCTLDKKVPKTCSEVQKFGGTESRNYSIDVDGKGMFKVYCDQKTDGGGWTVIQKRQDGSVDFYRGWNDYKNGFGNLTGEFWLGLDKIYRLTIQTRNRLRVELEDWENNTNSTVYAEYDYFAVADEKDNYKLSLGNYEGTAGDSLSWHRGMAFTTKDRDNDKSGIYGNCAVTFKGTWWYRTCHASNLNGLYHHGKHESFADGINWHNWKGDNYSAKKAEMKIRPV